jgi:quercetin dioxygenase-like cupin family protein
MKPALIAALVLLAFAITRAELADDERSDSAAAADGHDTGVMLPDKLEWKDTPALPPGAKVAVLEGDPTKEGYFAMRLRLPDGYRIPPHFHPCPERVTVLSGTFHLGTGDTFDPSKTQPLPAGTYWSMPPNMHHYAKAESETIVQITTIGPWGITYVNPSDDPRKK